MATYTPNLNLKKPSTGEYYDVVGDDNDAKDKIDLAVGEVRTAVYNLKDFGAIGDGITNDTQALKDAVTAFKLGGAREGNALLVPTGSYLITEKILIDAPITLWGMASGTASDLNKAPKFIFQNCGGFKFLSSAGYCDFKNIRFEGNKSTVDIATKSYGNVALDISYGSAGKFENMRIEGFDIGILTHTDLGQTWSGAYRYFNYLKVRNNTYSIAQLDFTTDSNFLQCDFRDAEINKKGYIYIEADSTGYQTTNFVDCLFELLGEREAPREFAKYGMQIKGKSMVKIIGGYLEACAIFVDKKASLMSSAYHKYGSAASVIGGGGYINLDGITGINKHYNLPLLSDTSFWTVFNNTYDGQVLDGNIRANKFTVTGINPSISTSAFTKFQELSFDAFPMDIQNGIVKVEVEFKAPIGKSLKVVPSGVTQATWNDEVYYTKDGAWRRMTFTFPLYLDRNETLQHTLRPVIFLDGGVAGDVFLIRALSYQILAE